MDPNGKKIKITFAIVEDDKNIKEDHRKDAEENKVKLKGSKQPRGPKREPSREWLDQSTAAYYLDMFMEDTYDFIIDHAPYLANGCFNFKDMSAHKEKKPKIILMVTDCRRQLLEILMTILCLIGFLKQTSSFLLVKK